MQVILIPGLWLVGSSWSQVVPALEAAGHQVHPLTPRGMGSRRLDRSAITLRDHVDDVVELIDELTADAGEASAPEVVLVAHSAGGALAHAAVDARPDKVARVVYVASEPRADGESAGGDWPDQRGEVPLPEWDAFDDAMLADLDDDRRAALRAGSIPSPVGVVRDAQRLADERRFEVPITMVTCEVPAATVQELVSSAAPGSEELAAIASVDYVDLPTGHWPQFSKPDELGRVLVEVLAG